MADYEQILTVKNETFVYNIPPRQSNRGYRAADWTLDKPAHVLRMRVVAKGPKVTIKLEDKNSGELFAQCPVDAYPGVAVEPVMDSSRYFVLRIMDESGRTAFIGAGFQDRADSFDLNVALQDHFRMMAKEKEIAVNKDKPIDSGPKLDLAFKEGQTIKLNITSNKPEGAKGRNRPQVLLGSGGLLPPPPGSKNPVLQLPPSNPQPVQIQQSAQPTQSQSEATNWVTFD